MHAGNQQQPAVVERVAREALAEKIMGDAAVLISLVDRNILRRPGAFAAYQPPGQAGDALVSRIVNFARFRPAANAGFIWASGLNHCERVSSCSFPPSGEGWDGGFG
jgi:hypothetical protein